MTTLHAQPSFLKLVVRDLSREVAFYQEAFGYETTHTMDGTIAGRAIDEVLLHHESTVALLLLSYRDGPAPEPSGVIVGVRTPDIDEFERRVLGAGGSVVQAIGPIDLPGGTSRLAFYADPEGYLLEVIEG